jgi:hypothetical protein
MVSNVYSSQAQPGFRQVDTHNLTAARSQPPDEQPVPAAGIQRPPTARRHGPQDQPLIVDVVVPVAGPLSVHPSILQAVDVPFDRLWWRSMRPSTPFV